MKTLHKGDRVKVHGYQIHGTIMKTINCFTAGAVQWDDVTFGEGRHWWDATELEPVEETSNGGQQSYVVVKMTL